MAESSRRVVRVSSAAIRSACDKTVTARRLMSPRLPMGVATMYRPAASAVPAASPRLLDGERSLGSSARLTRFSLVWFRREVWVRRPRIAAVVAIAFVGLLSACHDMSPRDYYIFGQPQASRPATQAPQQLPPGGPQVETTPAAPLEPVV